MIEERLHLLGETDLVSKTQLLAFARENGLALGDDRLDRWRESDLIEPSVPIPGTLQRGYGLAQARRIIAVARIAAAIPSERPSHAEIAFWLAYDGYYAPPNLILEHLERSVQMFQRSVAAILNGCDNSAHWASAGAATPLAPALVRFMLRRFFPTASRKGLIAQMLEASALALLHGLFHQNGRHVVFAILRRVLASRNLSTESLSNATDVIWDTIKEGMQLISLGEDNSMLCATREVARTNPEIAQECVADMRRIREIASQAFPWMKNARTLGSRPGLSDDDYAVVDRYLPASMCAVLLTTRDNPYTIALLQRLRQGDSTQALEEFQLMKQIVGEVPDLLTAAAP